MEWFYKMILHHLEGVLHDEMIKWGNESKTFYLRQLLTTLEIICLLLSKASSNNFD